MLAALVYSAIAGTIITAPGGPGRLRGGPAAQLLTLPVTFASVGVAVVTYATLRNRENPAVSTPALAAGARPAVTQRAGRAGRLERDEH